MRTCCIRLIPGTLRETFVVSQLNPCHEVEYGRESGDFVVDGRWRFEVGGTRKGFRQIAGITDSFVLADNIEYAVGNKLPPMAHRVPVLLKR